MNRAEKTISYTKNGLDLGVAFHNVKVDRLYPTVGLRTPDEEVSGFVLEAPCIHKVPALYKVSSSTRHAS